MARIDFIREIVERNGGEIAVWYSDGAKFRIRRSDLEWYRSELPSYKLVLEGVTSEVKEQIVSEINTWGVLAHGVNRAYLTRERKGKKGNIKVLFNEAYFDFKRGNYA